MATVSSGLALSLTVSCGGRSVSSFDATGEAPSQGGVADADPDRAYLALEDIEPRITPPKRPDGIGPLSARSARQIDRGRALAAEQRFTEALREVERALRYDPNHFEVFKTLAQMHYAAGNLEQAQLNAERALAGNPDSAAAHYIVGRVRLVGGDTENAVLALRTAALCSDMETDTETACLCHYRLAEALADAGYLEAALGQYDRFEARSAALSPDAREPELAMIMQLTRGNPGPARADVLERLARFAEAADALAPSFAATPQDTKLGCRYARLLLRAGRVDDARAAIDAIESDDPEVIELIFAIHDRKSDTQGALDDLRNRLLAHPDSEAIILAIADAHASLGRGTDALPELTRYADVHVQSDGVRARLVALLIELGRWHEAIEAMARRIEDRPETPGLFDDAIAAIADKRNAVATLLDDPQPAERFSTEYLLARLAARTDRVEEAITRLRGTIALEPDFVPARSTLATILLDRFLYDDAIEVAARREEDIPEDARLERLLGMAYRGLDDVVRAERHYKAALHLQRSDAETVLALAELYRETGRSRQAKRRLDVLLDEIPDHVQAREALFGIHLMNRDGEQAAVQAAELFRVAPNSAASIRCNAFLEAARARDFEKYRATLLASLKATGPDAETWIDIGDSFSPWEQGAAADAFANALAIDAKNTEAARSLAEARFNTLDFEGAADTLTSLLVRRPNRHAWRFKLIHYLSAAQDFEAALALAMAQNARDDLDVEIRTEFRLRVIALLHRVEREGEVATHLESWMAEEGAPQHWKIRLAREHLRHGEPAKGVLILEAAYKAHPDSEASLDRLVMALGAAGRSERAAQYVLDWLADDPESDSMLALLARVLSRGDRVADAIELVRNNLLRTRDRDRFELQLIDLLQQSKQYEEAILRLEQGVDVLLERASREDSPANATRLLERVNRHRSTIALILMEAKRYRDAERQLQEWIRTPLRPEGRVRFLLLLRRAQLLRGADGKSNATAEEALHLAPGHVGLNNDLAYTWIDAGTRLEEAERMSRYAVAEEPLQQAYLDTYGWLMYKKGAFEDAAKWLERAIGAGGKEDSVIRDHLGDAYFRLGRPKDAIEQWNLAIEHGRAESDDEEDVDALPVGADERRARAAAPKKIESVNAGRTPEVAPLAMPDSQPGSSSGDGSRRD
ncbi:MAG: tetratricopeptide repeat protein [Planctomycetes bacterium]|nr:tetratricopeptide repeat protein [Planctomycetota bacterium]